VIKNRFFKEVFKMSSAAAQQASTKAHSNKLSYWTQPNPTHQKLKNLDPTKSNPTQPMDNSGTPVARCSYISLGNKIEQVATAGPYTGSRGRFAAAPFEYTG